MLFEITKYVIAEFAIWNQEIQFVFSEAWLKGKAQSELLYKLMLFNILYLSCYFEAYFQHCSKQKLENQLPNTRPLPVGIFPLCFLSVLFNLNSSLPFVLVTSHGQ